MMHRRPGALTILTIAFSAAICLGANIVQEAGGGRLSIAEQRSYYRPLVRYRGSFIDTLQLHCEFFRYCQPRENLPLLATFIMWGGTIEGAEAVRQYENEADDPWVGVVIMPETLDGAPANTGNWYWGTTWTDEHDRSWSVPWCHNAVVDLMNDLKYTDLIDSIFPGVTLDTNRFYGTGSSIGGTATNQICARHPEIFAAFHAHAGWTSFRGEDNAFFSDERGCLAFSRMIGGVSHGDYCTVDSSVLVRLNADQLFRGLGDTAYIAADYTDLGWYFGRRDERWNCRTPSFAAPYAFMTTGAHDDAEYQGDNLAPVLEMTRRGYTHNRVDAGHAAGGIYIRWRWLRRFRLDQSYLAFTNRDYGVPPAGAIGIANDLASRGWDPESIVDQPGYYRVQLTGRGTADVTLRRLQRLLHNPGTVYALAVNEQSRGTVVADRFGLVTLTAVSDNALIELEVVGSLATVRPVIESQRRSRYDIAVLLRAAGRRRAPARTAAFSPNGSWLSKHTHTGIAIYQTTGEFAHEDR
jgi:hypothetical protein